jgi:hypothetical protein
MLTLPPSQEDWVKERKTTTNPTKTNTRKMNRKGAQRMEASSSRFLLLSIVETGNYRRGLRNSGICMAYALDLVNNPAGYRTSLARNPAGFNAAFCCF